MARKYIPLFFMLIAGAVTCVITFLRDYSIVNRMTALLVVMVVFFLLGSIMKSTMDYFERQNKKEDAEAESGETTEEETTTVETTKETH